MVLRTIRPCEYEIHWTFNDFQAADHFALIIQGESKIFRNVSRFLKSEDVYLVTVKDWGEWKRIEDRYILPPMPQECIRRKVETEYRNTDPDLPDVLYLECHVVSDQTFIYKQPPITWQTGKSFSDGKNYLTFRVNADKMPKIASDFFADCQHMFEPVSYIKFHEEMIVYDDNVALDKDWFN
jgi:hypothetical protein